MSTDKTPYNAEGQAHGLWVVYWFHDQLYYTGKYVNGKYHGYWETYYSDGSLCAKGTYDMGKRIGYWRHGNRKVLYAD